MVALGLVAVATEFAAVQAAGLTLKVAVVSHGE